MAYIPLETISPAGAGVSQIALTRFIKALDKSSANMRGFILLRQGKIVAEQYWEPYAAEHKNWVYSVSKSFTSTAVGLAYDEALLHPDDYVLPYFPEIDSASLNEHARNMRVRDLLSMTSGHGEDTTIPMMFAPGSWEQAFFGGSVDHAPGTYFEYNSGASYMLSSIVTRVTGKCTFAYLNEKLFGPLGFGDVAGDLNPEGVFTGGWGLMLRLEDLAKLGQLYLNKGLWEGKRILSQAWVDMATAFQSDNGRPGRENESPDWRQGYGFQFWMCRHGAYRADGAAGQYCVVLPEQGAVLALMSEIGNMQELMDILWDVLLPGLTNTASPREAALQGLKYGLKGDTEDMKNAEFCFAEDGLSLEMEGGGERCSIESGRGRWREGVLTLPFGQMTMTPMYALAESPKRVSSCFHWTDPDTLQIDWVYLETPHRDRLVCRFREDEILFFLPGGDKDVQAGDSPDFTGRIAASTS